MVKPIDPVNASLNSVDIELQENLNANNGMNSNDINRKNIYSDNGDEFSINSVQSNEILPDLENESHSNLKNNSGGDWIENLIASWPEKIQNLILNNMGVKFVALSQVFGSLMNAMARVLETKYQPPISALEILVIRMSITSVGSMLVLYLSGNKNIVLGPPQIRTKLFFRGSIGFIDIFCWYYSLTYLSIAELVVIGFLIPPVTGLFCYLLLGERYTFRELTVAAISLLGVGLISRPEFIFGHSSSTHSDDNNSSQLKHDIVSNTQHLIAVGSALLCIICASFTFVIIRSVGNNAHPLYFVNYYSMFAVAGGLFGLFIYPAYGFVLPESFSEFLLMATFGIIGFIYQFLFTAGLQRERAAKATSFIFLSVLFALFFDWLIWNTLPDLAAISGSVLILGSAVYLIMGMKK